jgi:hypothetical protein
MLILQDAAWITSQLLGLVSFWVPPWFHGVLANSLAFSSLPKRLSMLLSLAVARCCSQLLWMMATLRDFGLEFSNVPLLCDSTCAISIAKNLLLHSKTKDINVCFHFLRDHYEEWDIDLHHVDTHKQLADILRKPLDPSTFGHLRGELGVCFPFS